MTLRKLQSNFTSGELSDDLIGRTDLPIYANGASRLRNVRPLPGGGVRRRGGLQHMAVVPRVPYQHETWIFNYDQTYQILFYDAGVRIHDGVTGAHLQTISGCPWTAAMLSYLSVFTQGDYAFIAHPDMPTQQLRRTGASSFVREAFTYDKTQSGSAEPVWQPYHRYIRNDQPLRITAVSGYTDTNGWAPGAVATLSTGGGTGWTAYDFFQVGHVGTYLEICGSQWLITARTDAQTATATLKSESFRAKLTENAFTILTGITVAKVFDPFHDMTVGQVVVPTQVVAFGMASYDQINGAHAVTSVDDSNWTYNYAAMGPVLNAPITGGGPNAGYWSSFIQTVDWKEQMYSPVRGYPHCVGGFQSRLVLGGGRDATNRLNFSRVEGPFNYDPGTGADDDAILVGVSGRRTPTIQHIVGGQHVQIFSSEGEYYIPHGVEKAALTPTTIAVIPQTFYGSQKNIPVVEFDDATLFISRNGGHLRQFVMGDGGYLAPDLSFVSHHLIEDPVWLAVQMEDRDQAAAAAMVVNGDGSLAVLTMMRSEKIAAWSAHTTTGTFETACAIDSRAFFVVFREVAGVEVAWLEMLDLDRYLDGSVMGSYVGRVGQAYRWGGFSIYANSIIHVLADGLSDLGPVHVSPAGTVDIMSRADTLEGGLPFQPLVRTLPPELALADGPSPGEPRRVVSAHVRFQETMGATVRTTKVSNTVGDQDLGLPGTPSSGFVQVHLLGWDDLGQVDVSQSSSGPFGVTSINLELEF